ncbi:MAG: restriction endonuclease subunit S [bacterium]|nr:restriction endonuclease subunit S [bacterium]
MGTGQAIGINSQFLLLKLNESLEFKRFATKQKKGGTRTRLYLKSLSSWKTLFPSIAEQKEIASFITSIDEWIENIKNQKQSLEIYKKGMMQKIFSRKIHFKDDSGQKYPEWEIIPLGSVFTERMEKKVGENLELLSINQSNGITKQKNSIKRDNSSLDKSNYKVVREYDIAYNTMRMWQGASGVSKYTGIVSPAYTVVTLMRGNVEFYGFLFKYPRTVFNFYRYSQGLTSDTWNLKFQHFSEILVTVPTSIEEQKKIALFLSSLDELIDLKQKKIKLAEQWKKGLMQQMFV